MYFTQEDFRKIEKWLQRKSVKDTDFQESAPLEGDEIVAIVQGGHNRKMPIGDFINQVFKLGVSDFLNVTDKYEAPNITLEEAISLIPCKSRKLGQVITFLNEEGNWQIYQFKGTLEQWNNTDLWEEIIRCEGGGSGSGGNGGSTGGGGSLPENISAEATAYSSVVATAEASVNQSTGLFSFKFGLPKGDTGPAGADGKDGKDGINGQPGVDGKDGTDGADGNSTEFIYKRTLSDDAEKEGVETAPKSDNIDEYVPSGWTDSPVGITNTWQIEWVCKRTKKDGDWGEWSKPSIWSKWGYEGRDGDGVEYIYLRNTGTVPDNPTPDDISTDEYQGKGDYFGKEYVPTELGWTDNPKGITLAYKFEWVCTRKYKNGLWSEFTDPVLWARYGENGEKGDKGDKGDPGTPGESVVTMRTVFAFRTFTPTEEVPECPYPEGGYWNVETNEITYPEGWGPTDNIERPVYMSTGDFVRDAPSNPTWSKPVDISGKDGINGADGTNVEYVYKLTLNDLEAPNAPTENVNETGHVPNVSLGWTASPQGISEALRAEWVSIRKKLKDGSWGNWEAPTLWSKWGSNGTDGDGVQYIFLRNNGGILTNPTPKEYLTDEEYQNKNNEYIPTIDGEGTWTDEPKGVEITATHEWVSIRKYRYNEEYKKMMWGAYSDPALWAKYGDRGYDGLSIRTMYRVTPTSSDAPVGLTTKEASSSNEDYVFITDNINPGSDWSIKVPTDYKYPEAVWSISAYVNYKNELVEIEISDDDGKVEKVYGWQGPILVSGIKGDDGIDPNWKLTVFKLKSSRPNGPTFNTVPESYPTEDGWKDFIDSQSKDEDGNQTTQWWQCIGIVNGEDNTVEWGTVLNVNGQDGIAQDGKHWEIRFRASKDYDTVPTYSADERDPNTRLTDIGKDGTWDKGWVIPSSTTPAPTPPSGGVVWEIMAEITPDNLLVDGWCAPFRTAGERGPQGETGPTGPTGPSGPTGIPGTRFELKYCAGDFNGPEVIPEDKDYTNSEAWLDFVPTTNAGSPYIWCVQGKKVYANAQDTTGTITWGEPFKLNGLDGQDGGTGVGISSVDEYYLVSAQSSGITTSSTGWVKNSIPAFTSELIYLWNYEVINYDNGTSANPTTPAILTRAGKDGKGIASITEYYLASRYPTKDHVDSNGSFNASTSDIESRWSEEVPTTSTAKPYIWNKEVIEYDNGNTEEFISLIGARGSDGEDGKRGQLVYPAGVYSDKATYVCDNTKAPYVLYDGDFYVLNTIMDWVGTQQNSNPASSNAWVKFDSFEAIYADIGVFNQALVGSAVFYKQFMFSQQGINANGGYSDSFEYFNPNNPYLDTNTFRPNWCVNLATGEQWLGAGKTYFAADGSGHLADGNISWTSNGTLTLPPSAVITANVSPIDTKGNRTLNYSVNVFAGMAGVTAKNITISLSNDPHDGTIQTTIATYTDQTLPFSISGSTTNYTISGNVAQYLVVHVNNKLVNRIDLSGLGLGNSVKSFIFNHLTNGSVNQILTTVVDFDCNGEYKASIDSWGNLGMEPTPKYYFVGTATASIMLKNTTDSSISKTLNLAGATINDSTKVDVTLASGESKGYVLNISQGGNMYFS